MNRFPQIPQAVSWFTLLAAAIIGCESNNLAPVDVKITPPFVTSVQVGPSAINVDTLTPANGNYSVATIVTARISNPDGTGNVARVVAEALRPSASSPFKQIDLHDDGLSPDLTSNDSIYSGTLPFELTRPQAGRYRIRVFAEDSQGLQSNAMEVSFFALRNNSAPTLANLDAPDTVIVPVGGGLLVHITISAADSDGLADVREVFFRSLDSSIPDVRFFLKDDGGTEPVGPPFFQPSGDTLVGDGEYSVLIPLVDGPTVRRTNRFAFQAWDGRDTSATLLHYLTVQ